MRSASTSTTRCEREGRGTGACASGSDGERDVRKFKFNSNGCMDGKDDVDDKEVRE